MARRIPKESSAQILLKHFLQLCVESKFPQYFKFASIISNNLKYKYLQTELEDVLKVMHENKTNHHRLCERTLKVCKLGKSERERNLLITQELTHCVFMYVWILVVHIVQCVVDTSPGFVPHLASRKTRG